MKLCQKIGLGLTALALAAGTYLSCLEQKALKQDIQKISQSQTLESELSHKPKGINLTKEQKDAIGYIIKIASYNPETKEIEEPKIIAVSNADMKDVQEAAAEQCNSQCLVYQDGDGNYRMAKGIGSIYFDNECLGRFKGNGWLIYTPYGDGSWGKNKSDISNIEPQNMIEYEKCD